MGDNDLDEHLNGTMVPIKHSAIRPIRSLNITHPYFAKSASGNMLLLFQKSKGSDMSEIVEK